MSNDLLGAGIDIKAAHRLWGGRFAAAQAPAFEAVNRSVDIDFRLWPHDVRLSQAWAVALWHAGVLSMEESERMVAGLGVVARKLAAGAQPAPADEDVHTTIDRMLHDEIGDLAAKLHTGRSRNDQVATATRLWTMEACAKLDLAIRDVQAALVQRAESLGDALMPAYTHLQRAQPIVAAHWMLAHFWPLERDRGRVAAACKGAATLPLGAGAVAGSAYPVSRRFLQGTLGFRTVSENSIDAVSDRDFVAETLFALATLGAHLSRLAEDLVIFGTSEFGFVRYGDAYASGSSMMPQKRNPDALELTRASAGRAIGDLTALLATLKGLPSGYNKDLQEDKRILFGGVDAALALLPAVAGCVRTLEFRTERMAAALSSDLLATDLADGLVRKGASFREAHAAVGKLVREAELQGVPITELDADALAVHPLLDGAALRALSMNASVALRDVEGGTGPASVRSQLDAAWVALAGG